MKLIGKVRTFNTGRGYASNGQEITWAVIRREDGKECVAFIDHARMIDGVIELYVGNLDLITDKWVLNAYDNYHYHLEYKTVQFLRDNK